ncbi:MAG: guanylate kinase [Lachnospiraceae bacterium]|nr:guanylate kinase [Lachnospiraceae bacterium]
MGQKGRLVVISGFSGAGKGTLMKALLAAHPDRYALSVSATTRDPRPGEQDGIDYFFVTDEKFHAMIKEDDFLEYAGYVGHYYGTPRSYVEKNLAEGKNVILEIEIQGALHVKEKIKDAVLMFVTAPDADTLKERLTGRGTETGDVIAARLSRACEEARGIENYDYLVVNDTVEHASELIDTLISDERNGNASDNEAYRVSANIDFINQIREDLKQFSKGE